MEPKSMTDGRQHTDAVKQFHDEAYLYVDQALSLEESGCGLQALAIYEKGLQKLEQGLSIPTDLPHFNGEQWDVARMLQMKMRKSKEHVLCRLEALSKERGGAAMPPGYSEQFLEMPPSYEEACLEPPATNEFTEGVQGPSGTNGQKKSFFDLCSQMDPMDVDGMETFSQVPAEAKEIFSIGDGVQIFFVSSNGTVSAPTYPTALTIYKFSDGSVTPTGLRRPPAFLQVGDWVYPLHPGRMPVLHTSYGAYMLPDTNAQRPGSAVGILLADDVPQAMRDVFEHLMCELTALRSEPADASQRRLSTKISDGIVIGAEYASKGVVIAAEKTSEYVRIGARKLRERMAPAGNPTHVDPRVQKGMQIAKDVSDVAVRVSGFVLSQLGRATMALGHQIAPHVRRQGAKLISKAMGEENNPEKGNATMDGMMEVASGGLKGFSTVYMGLETAASILAKGIISETVQTVNYRYGPEAGQTTGTTLYAAGNFAMTAHNVGNMGVKAIAKRAAKDTGKAMVRQHEEQKGSTEKINGAVNGEKK